MISAGQNTRASGSKAQGAVKKILLWMLGVGGTVLAGVSLWPRLEAKLFRNEVKVGQVMVVSASSQSSSLTATGYVKALKLSKVAPTLVGRVSEVLVEEGASVHAGDVLYRLDVRDVESSIRAARARMAAQEASVKTQEANAQEVERQLERQRGLLAGGATSRAVVEDLETRQASLRALVSAAGAQVKAERAQIASLEVGRSQLEIRSPIDGVVLNKPPALGDILGPSLGVGSEPLQIADFQSLVVEVDVAENKIAQVKKGKPCEIVLESFPGVKFSGVVLDIGKLVNRAKATIVVKVAFTGQEHINTGALPEMSARVSFFDAPLDEAARNKPDQLMVPASARHHGNRVWVVKDGIIQDTPITLLESCDADMCPIDPSGELKEGDKVVLTPSSNLSQGVKVKEAE